MSDLLRVLLVEDNPGDADLIVELLQEEGSSSFEVENVSRLAEALEHVGKDRFDIILLDLGLPDSDGLATLRSLQRKAPELPIVVLTGNNDERVALAAIQENAQDYLIKGQIDKHHLSRAIKYAVERKRAKEQIHTSEEKYRRLSQEYHLLLDNLPDGIVQIAPDYRVIWANRSMMEMVKMDEAHLKGARCFQALCGKEEVCNSCPAARSFDSGKMEEETFTTTNGMLLELRSVPIADDSGKIKSVIEVFRDITEHRKLEAQLRQAQKMESIGTLAGGIAHDFNNILTAIVGYGYMAQLNMEPDDPKQENIKHMLEGADRAAHLTKDLLLFSRKQVSEKAPVDLNEIVSHLEKFMTRIIGEDIIFSIALHGEPTVIYADTHHLEQVLMNLVTNARDAMSQGGSLAIRTEQITLRDDFIANHGYGKPGRYALLSVSDTGTGMDEDTRKKIFEPFFTTKAVGRGTGLGLAVAYGIIKDHDGYITVHSEPGAGTTFKLFLPLISSETRQETIADKKEAPIVGTETLLLVEDDESTRELIGIILKERGYTVIEAVDGKDGLKKFMENRETIQLLISDLIMPIMNGKEAFDEMKVWRPELKAVFISGYAPDAIREKVRLESGVAMISKPILPHVFLKTIRTVLDGGEK